MSDAHARGDGHTPVGHVALVVGPGDRFLSGVSYYTALLASALAEHGPVAMLLLRRHCPRALYPGRARVGKTDGTRRNAERYAALLDRIDARWSRDGRIPAERTVKSSVAGEVE